MRRALSQAFFVFIFLSFFLPKAVSADTLFLSPLTGTYSVGDTFTMRVMVSSPRQAINALSGVVSFPSERLQVTSVSKIGSVLSLWVQEPSFSNSKGTVNFEGVVPNPGFQESNGRVLAVNFKVVGTGTAEVRLISGSLLANDGYGTNILRTLGSSTYVLEEGHPELPQTPPAVIENGNSDQTAKESPPPPVQAPVSKPKISFEFWLPSLETVGNGAIKFLSIVIPLLALLFFLIATTKRGVGSLRKLKKNMRRDLHGLDRMVEKSFGIIREDLGDIIHMLEHTQSRRKLTTEEGVVVHRLKQNLLEAEKIIQDEIANAEKDLDE